MFSRLTDGWVKGGMPGCKLIEITGDDVTGDYAKGFTNYAQDVIDFPPAVIPDSVVGVFAVARRLEVRTEHFPQQFSFRWNVRFNARWSIPSPSLPRTEPLWPGGLATITLENPASLQETPPFRELSLYLQILVV